MPKFQYFSTFLSIVFSAVIAAVFVFVILATLSIWDVLPGYILEKSMRSMFVICVGAAVIAGSILGSFYRPMALPDGAVRQPISVLRVIVYVILGMIVLSMLSMLLQMLSHF